MIVLASRRCFPAAFAGRPLGAAVEAAGVDLPETCCSSPGTGRHGLGGRPCGRHADAAGMPDPSDPATDPSLPQGGRLIGKLERLMIFMLVLSGEIVGIGLLIAAKSILRFGEIQSSESRQIAEYVIIGTLASFAWALGVAHLGARRGLATARCTLRAPPQASRGPTGTTPSPDGRERPYSGPPSPVSRGRGGGGACRGS
jgi:hypothetical protein